MQAVYPWKGGRTGPGGIEWYNYPSVLAQQYWYYVLCVGKAWPKPRYRHGHGTEDGFLIHYVRRGEFWYRMRGQEYRAPAQTVCLMELSEPVEYGNDRRATADVWWMSFNGHDMPHMFTELRADRDPLFDHLDTHRVEELFRQLFELIRRQPPAYEGAFPINQRVGRRRSPNCLRARVPRIGPWNLEGRPRSLPAAAPQ